MTEMFYGAKMFNQSLEKWNVQDALSYFDYLKDFFKDSGISKENYCKTIQNPVFKNNMKKLGVSFVCNQ